MNALAAFIALASLGWAKQPATPVTLNAPGFVVQTSMPQGWTYTNEGSFVAPSEIASTCRVSLAFHSARSWDEFLVAALRPTDPRRREVVKIGGHAAVSVRHGAFRDIYIDLSSLHAGSGAVWTLEQRAASVPSDCELQFLAIVNKATITRSPDAASPATP